MKGNNELILCHAQMIEMVQYYFDNELFADGNSPKVSSVSATTNSFIVRTISAAP